MNISFFELSQYWSILSANLLPILFAAIMGGLLGFVFILIIQIILRKKILVQRKYVFFKYMAYVYMVFFPLFAGFCSSCWFALHKSEKQLVAAIPSYLGGGNELFNTYLKAGIEMIIEPEYLQLTGKQTLNKALYATVTTVDDIAQYAGIPANKTEAIIVRYLLEVDMVRDFIVTKFATTVGDKLYLDKGGVEKLLDVQLQNLLDDGILNTVIEKQIRSLFGGFKMNVFLFFLFGISLPVAEIIWSNYREQKRLREQLLENEAIPGRKDA